MSEKVGFFEEKPGVKSSMRLMSFLSLLAAMGMGVLTLYSEGSADGLMITFGFLLGAFAPKTVQKFAEQKISS
jgi:hypothetical protein